MAMAGARSLRAGRRIAAALVALGVHGACVAGGEASPDAWELHSAECVAALELQAEDLAAQIRAGDEALRPALMTQLEYGAAFIGTAYLRGERDEQRSQSLLDDARQRQTALSAKELQLRQAACAQEASRLLAEASAFGRAVVARVAKRRMVRLLDR